MIFKKDDKGRMGNTNIVCLFDENDKLNVEKIIKVCICLCFMHYDKLNITLQS